MTEVLDASTYVRCRSGTTLKLTIVGATQLTASLFCHAVQHAHACTFAIASMRKLQASHWLACTVPCCCAACTCHILCLLHCNHETQPSLVTKGEHVPRPIYAGNALETVQCSADSLQMFSVRPTAFEKASTAASTSATVESVSSEDLAAAQVGTCRPVGISE